MKPKKCARTTQIAIKLCLDIATLKLYRNTMIQLSNQTWIKMQEMIIKSLNMMSKMLSGYLRHQEILKNGLD